MENPSMQEQLASIRERVFRPEGADAEERPGTEESIEDQPHDEDEIDIELDANSAELEEDGESPEEGGLGDRFDVAKLAAAIDVDPEFLYNGLTLTIRKGDESEEIPFSQIKDRLQDAVVGGADLVQQQQAFNQQVNQFNAYAQQFRQAADNLSQEERAAFGAMVAAESEYASIAELERTDPERFDREERRLARVFSTAKQRYEEAQGKKQQLSQQQRIQANQWHGQQLAGRIPEWQNLEVAEKETVEIAKWLLESGFGQEELSDRIDFRQRVIDRKAWLWDQHQAEIQKAQKRVRKAPRTLAPGQGQRSTISKQKVQRLKDRAKETGRDQDVMAAAKAIFRESRR